MQRSSNYASCSTSSSTGMSCRRFSRRVACLVVAPTNGNVSDSDMVLLKAQLSDLSGLVRAQQRTIEQQQNTIDSLKSQEARHPLLMSGGEAAGWRSNSMAHPRATASTGVSPFDSQRIGIGDRRMLGLFDSRFHSTSKYVLSITPSGSPCMMHSIAHACSSYISIWLS